MGAARHKKDGAPLYPEVAGGNRTKCDKCGKIIDGGRRKLNQHKKEHHSY